MGRKEYHILYLSHIHNLEYVISSRKNKLQNFYEIQNSLLFIPFLNAGERESGKRGYLLLHNKKLHSDNSPSKNSKVQNCKENNILEYFINL